MDCAKDPPQKSAHGPNGWCSLNHLLMNLMNVARTPQHGPAWNAGMSRVKPLHAFIPIHPQVVAHL